ncbi:MAG: hypothetical protein J5964_07215 [Eubacterium sp.]|nr:hypothetical protein [Eubacterium sp.]
MKSFKITVVILAVLSLLAGHFSPYHLKDLMIIEGIGIDSGSDGYAVSAQLLNSNFLTDELPKENSTFTLYENAESVSLAISNMQKSVSKKIYFGQSKLLVLSEECAEKGFGNKIPFTVQSLNLRSDIALCIFDGKSKKLLESGENGARVPCESLLTLLLNGEKAGQCVYTRAYEITENSTGDIALTVLEYNDSADIASIKGIGVFSDGKLVKTLSGESTQGFLILSGKLNELEIELYDKKLGKVNVSVQDIKTKRSAKTQDGRIKLHCDIFCDLTVKSAERKPPSALDKSDNERIKSALDRKLSHLCESAFYNCTRVGSDSLRILDTLCLSSKSDYEKCRSDRQKYLKTSLLSLNIIIP